MHLFLFLGAVAAVQPIETGWRPIPGPGSSLGPSPTPLIPRNLGYPSRYPHRQRPPQSRPPVCTLYKATFDQDLFPQVSDTNIILRYNFLINYIFHTF